LTDGRQFFLLLIEMSFVVCSNNLIIGITRAKQEEYKPNFNLRDTKSLDERGKLSWHYTPSVTQFCGYRS
jgi:hypothetical protein